jgi:sec-independent protein translocase protein TatC
MPIGPARMPLLDHLGELRMRLVRIVAVLIIAILVFYFATPTIIDFLINPIRDSLPTDATGNAILNVLDPLEAFSVRFSVSFWASIVATSPIIIWQILAFFLPALKPKERKWFIPTFVAATALFIVGTLFCYFIILQPAFAWLTDQAMGIVQVDARASSYVDIIIKFEIGFGFAFELPLVVFYLTVFGVIPYAKLRAQWRIVYTVLIVLSAMITPDASPVTMLLMFAALIVLYEGSLFMSRIVLGKEKIKAQAEEAAARAAEEEEMQAEWEEHKAKRRAERDA